VTRLSPGDRGGEPFPPGERLDLPAGLAAFTVGSAYALRPEAETGSTEPGKLADLAVLDRDPLHPGVADRAGARVLGVIEDRFRGSFDKERLRHRGRSALLTHLRFTRRRASPAGQPCWSRILRTSLGSAPCRTEPVSPDRRTAEPYHAPVAPECSTRGRVRRQDAGLGAKHGAKRTGLNDKVDRGLHVAPALQRQ